MCKPASFVIVKKGGLKVLWDKAISESHEDIIEYFGLNETNVRGEITFCRVEIIPPNDDFSLPLSKWEFCVDQDILPFWWNAKKAEAATRKELKAWRDARVVLPGKTRKEIAGNDYVTIVLGTVEFVCDSATVKSVSGSATVESVYGSATVTQNGPQIQSAICDKNAVVIDRSVTPPKCYVGPQK